VIGVQFHPESAASEYGYAMLDRFLHGARAQPERRPNRADGAYGAATERRSGDESDGGFVPPPVELVR
jgi:hypothetical protein